MIGETGKGVLGYAPEYQRIAGILGPAARVCEAESVTFRYGMAIVQKTA